VTVASESGREGHPVHRGKAAGWLSQLFELSPAGANWPRGIGVLAMLLGKRTAKTPPQPA
jgi:hypothetical protein